jgi:glyoxylase-like metal-dependent hydrolase (beta-lactamase superfamily II)
MSLLLERFGDVSQIYLSSLRSRLAGYGVYIFLVRGTLIDTGFHGVRKHVGGLLDELRPKSVALTHHHEDHTGNLELVASRGIPVAAPGVVLEALRAAPPLPAYRRVVWGEMPTPDLTPERIELDGLQFISTPGHSSDHHIIWDAERRTLFAGDLFLGVRVRVARADENPRALVRSLRAAIALRPRALFDAHRGWVKDPVAALEAKVAWLEETLTSIDRRIDDGLDDRAIAREVLGAEDSTHVVSRGELSRRNLVTAARTSRDRALG